MDDLLRLDAGLGPDLLVDLAGQGAVLALQHSPGLLGEGLVPLAHDDVHDGLGAHDLGGGGHQRGIAEVLPDTGDLSQHIVVLVLLAGLLELADQVGQHAAGHLVEQGVGVHVQDLGVQGALVLQPLGHLAEVGGGVAHLVQVQTGIPGGTLQGGHQGLGGGLGGAVGQGAEGGVHDVHAGVGGHEVDHVAGAGGVVGVEVDGHVHALLQPLDQGVGVHGQQQVGHVLDAQGVGAHLLQLLGQLHEVVLVVDGGDGVGEGGLHDAAVLLGGLDGLLQVPHVVEGVEDADDVDAVLNGLAAEGVHHVVGVVLVAQDVLAPEEHLQLGVGQVLAQGPQPLPGVLLQKAHAHIEGGAAPALQGVVADGVQHLAGGEHVLDPHTGGGLGLVGVTEDGVRDLQGLIGQKFHSFHRFILLSISRTAPSVRRRRWRSR